MRKKKIQSNRPEPSGALYERYEGVSKLERPRFVANVGTILTHPRLPIRRCLFFFGREAVGRPYSRADFDTSSLRESGTNQAASTFALSHKRITFAL